MASERVWQEIPRLIAAQWGSFTQHQSPLSTMGMIARACETVLKIRVAAHRGGGRGDAAAGGVSAFDGGYLGGGGRGRRGRWSA